ncbi:MAG TPA: isoprenylcysteine carboxylmethyltransferase family protein [Solirubrobacteraceae bacterium]|nr:isoprenylcysteine carboxylmethyltransferase family protein [Solirubrobacteraceae bacterium]
MTREPPNPELFGLRPNNSRLNRARARSAAGSALFLAVAPGTMAILIPYLLTGWDAGDAPAAARIAGAALALAGAAVLLDAFARFALQGLGTPSPTAPTDHLVVTGPNRYVRNPMYLAVTATILGQWLLLGRPVLLAYAITFVAITYAFVRGYEEPTLRARYGAEYERYRASVPGWWPRRIEKT